MGLNKTKNREWYLANRERILAEKKAQYKMIGPVKRERQRKYRSENIDKVRQADRERWPERKHDERYRQMQREKANAWYQKNKEYVKARNRDMMLLRTYGITAADYAELREKQGGVCAICRKHPEDGVNLAVDHCHETGLVRGLLCDGCNFAIGRLGDNSCGVRRAFSYLAAFEDSMEKASA